VIMITALATLDPAISDHLTTTALATLALATLGQETSDPPTITALATLAQATTVQIANTRTPAPPATLVTVAEPTLTTTSLVIPPWAR
jgi:hypothetical protein